MMYCPHCEYVVTYDDKAAKKCPHCGKNPNEHPEVKSESVARGSEARPWLFTITLSDADFTKLSDRNSHLENLLALPSMQTAKVIIQREAGE